MELEEIKIPGEVEKIEDIKGGEDVKGTNEPVEPVEPNNVSIAIQATKDKKYSEFEDAIKKELGNKLANNPTIKKYSDGIDKMQALKNAFAAINKPKEVEEIPEEKNDGVDNKTDQD